MKPSSTLAIASENFDDYLLQYSELDRLAQPLDAKEAEGSSHVILPRAEELVRPFLNGLKKSCALGTHVGTVLSQDQHTPRTLSGVIERARAAAIEVPELLLAPVVATVSKVRHTAAPQLAAYQTRRSEDDDLEEEVQLAAMNNPRYQRNQNKPFKPRLLRPNEPEYDPSKVCTVHMALHPDYKNPGRGHEECWCPLVLGHWNPKDPNCPAGPATEAQILKTLKENVRIARYGKESVQKSAPPAEQPGGSSSSPQYRSGARQGSALNAIGQTPSQDDSDTDPDDDVDEGANPSLN